LGQAESENDGSGISKSLRVFRINGRSIEGSVPIEAVTSVVDDELR
jgi:hypothetical protein